MSTGNSGVEHKSRAILLILALVTAVGCVETTDVLMPEEIPVSSTFEAQIVSTVTSGYGEAQNGWIGIMVPNGWALIGGDYEGPGTTGPLYPPVGEMLSYLEENIEGTYPTPPWGYWAFMIAAGPLEGDLGSEWIGTVTIQNDELEGTVVLEILSGVLDTEIFWDGPLFPCSVSVSPQVLSQETWGSIKACPGER